MDYATSTAEVSEISEILPALAVGGIAILFVFFWILIIVIPFYIYQSIAWMQIGKKLNYPNSWLAWVPFGRTIMILQMAGLPWELVFLYLLPIIGWIAIWIIYIIAEWKVFEKRNYPGALALIQLGQLSSFFFGIFSLIFSIGYLVAIGLVAWKNQEPKTIQPSNAPVPSPPATTVK